MTTSELPDPEPEPLEEPPEVAEGDNSEAGGGEPVMPTAEPRELGDTRDLPEDEDYEPGEEDDGGADA
jgi:hypothetical protein